MRKRNEDKYINYNKIRIYFKIQKILKIRVWNFIKF